MSSADTRAGSEVKKHWGNYLCFGNLSRHQTHARSSQLLLVLSGLPAAIIELCIILDVTCAAAVSC